MQFKAKELNPHINKNKVYFGGETKWVQIIENNWNIFFKYSTLKKLMWEVCQV